MEVFNDMVAQIMENINQGGTIRSSVSKTHEGRHTFSKRIKYIIKWVPKVSIRLHINLIYLEWHIPKSQKGLAALGNKLSLPLPPFL